MKVYNQTLNIDERNIENFVNLANLILDLASSDEDLESEQVFPEIPLACYPIPTLNHYLGPDVDIAGLELETYLQSLYEYITIVADEYISFSVENPYKTDYELLDCYNRFLGITEGEYAADTNPRSMQYFEHVGIGRLDDTGALEFINIDDSHLHDDSC